MKKIFFLLVMMGLVHQVNAQAGNWLWGRQATGDGTQEPTNLTVDAFGNIYATGGCYPGSTIFGNDTLLNPTSIINVFLVKYDANANPVWAKMGVATNVMFPLTVNVGNSVAADALGNVYVTGYFEGTKIIFGSDTLTAGSFFGHTRVFFIVKYDANGNVLWAKKAVTANGYDKSVGNFVTTDAAGGVFVTGEFSDSLIVFDTVSLAGNGISNLNMFIVKYDANGNALWAKTTGGSGNSSGKSITTDLTGKLLVTGTYSSSTVLFDTIQLNAFSASNSQEMFVSKYDANGNVIWAKGAGEAGFIEGSSIATDPTLNAYVTGNFRSKSIVFGSDTLINADTVNPKKDLFLVKYNSQGDVVWAKGAGGKGQDDVGYSVATDDSGIYVSTGSHYGDTISFGIDTFRLGNYIDPMAIVKYDFEGNVICASALISGGDDNNSVATDGLGNVYVLGDFATPQLYLGADTLTLNGPTSSTESFFIAKYSCNDISHEGISEISDNSETTLYPNPATSTITLQSTGNKIEQIKLMNVLGECIYQCKINTLQAEIDISGIAKGIYFVEITEENKTVVNRKVVVQ